jgi:phosphatidylinositol alpha-mannosyltransferase
VKIGIVCPYDLGRPGGVQAHILALARAMTEHGHYVRVIAPTGGRPENLGGTTIHLFGSRRSIVFNQTRIDVSLAWGGEAARLSTWLAQEAFDVLQFHTVWDPFLPWQILRRAGPAARVATFHDTPPETFQGRVTRRVFRVLSRRVARRVDRVTTVSPAPAGHLTPSPGTELAILPPAIDVSPIAAHAAAPRPDRERVEILFVGRLDARKGVEILIEAYARLEHEGLPVSLRVIGGGDRQAAVAAKVMALRLRNVSLEGPVSEEKKVGYLARADILCAPSPHGESFGLVLVEAMAAGLAVVAAANPGYSTVLAGGPPEALVPPNDVAALVQRLRAIVLSPDRRRAMADWGRANWKQHDISTWSEAFEAVFQSAIERRRARA